MKVRKKLRKKFCQLKDTFFKNVRIIFMSFKYFIQNSTRIVERDYASCVESLLHLGQESCFMWGYFQTLDSVPLICASVRSQTPCCLDCMAIQQVLKIT